MTLDGCLTYRFHDTVIPSFICYVMPISSNGNNPGTSIKKLSFNVRGKSATSRAETEGDENEFLTIAPALPILPGALVPTKLSKRSHGISSSSSSIANGEDDPEGVGGCDVVALQQADEGRTIIASRATSERDKNPDRICLDRRGLTTFPTILGETKLRLLSLQHNLLAKIEPDKFSQLTKLVFLDLYDNQIERVCNLDTLENLRVLLMGKNRIKRIEGLERLIKLEVLDFHGNQITQISGLGKLGALKVLNLAGNDIKNIGCNDFQGLSSLKELNLRRNKIKKLLAFGETPELQKLYVSNNDIQRIEDMASLAKALEIREVAIEGNPVTLSPDCVSFLVSYLPCLQNLSTMQVNEQVRRAAMAWRITKEQSNSAFLDLSSQICANVRREEAITNARTNWELLRSQARYIANINGGRTVINARSVDNASNVRDIRIRGGGGGFNVRTCTKIDSTRLKGLDRAKSKVFGSLTSINENIESKKIHIGKRSNSTENVIVTSGGGGGGGQRSSALDFKLPPILVPIINNLTSVAKYENETNRQRTIIGNNTNSLLPNEAKEIDRVENDDESHESLKSGLKDYLVSGKFPNHRTDPGIEYITDSEATKQIRENSYLEFVGRERVLDISPNESRNTNITDNVAAKRNDLEDFQSRDTVTGSITSSLDSCKSTISDSSCSSVSKISLDGSSQEIELNNNRVKSAQMRKMVNYKNNRAATARAKHRALPPTSPTSQPNPSTKEREQGGDYLVEINGRCLNVYGQGALRFIDRPWDVAKASEVNIIKFNYVQFNGIATILGKLKNRFGNAEHFIFKETNICHLGQINALAEVQGLSSVQIDTEGNPIVSKDWKMYAVFRLAHWGLQVINGEEISDRKIELANREYAGLTDVVMWSLPETLLQPLLERLQLGRAQKQTGELITAKQFLFSSDPALRNVVAKEALQWRRGNVTQDDLIWRHKGKVHLSNVIDTTVDAIRKLQMFEKEWPNILEEIVRDTLVDFTNMNAYMKRCTNELAKDTLNN